MVRYPITTALGRLLRVLRETIQAPSFRTLGTFAGGNLLVAVLGGLAGLIQARWIAPEVLGEYRKFGILFSYLAVGVSVVCDALARQFPYLTGKGKADEALKVAACAKWWYFFLCWIFSFVFAALSLTSVVQGDYRSAVGWGAQIPCSWAVMFGGYFSVMYRSSSDFERLAYNNTMAAVFGFGALVLVKAWGYWGLAARAVLQGAVGLYLARRNVPVKVKAVLDVKGLVTLAKISLPLSIPGYISTSFLSASLSFIILKYCGQSGLGVYGLALTFQAMAMTLSVAIQQMFITKLTYRFGATGDVAACLRWAKRPTLLSVGAATVLALVLCLAVGPFIRLILPKYEVAIPVIRILALQLPLAAAGLPLLIISTALWYRSVSALSLTRVLVCLAAVVVFPKTLAVIAGCMMLGDFAALIAGYGILQWSRCDNRVISP